MTQNRVTVAAVGYWAQLAAQLAVQTVSLEQQGNVDILARYTPSPDFLLPCYNSYYSH